MKPKSTVVNLPIYQPGKSIGEVQAELGLAEVVKLASNENMFGYSPLVRQALEEAMAELYLYPDGASRLLKEEIAKHYGISPERVIVSNGSDELVSLICRAYLVPGAETIMATPTFPRYKTNAEVEGAKVIEVPLKEGRCDLEAMLAAITPQTRIIWICSPNNPTGSIVTREEFTSFMEQVPPEVLVVSDEAYYEYVTHPEYPDTLSMQERWPNLLIMRTFSKAYGLAALRIGYGITAPQVIDPLNRVREPFNVNHLAQVAAAAALKDQEFIARCREMNRQGMAQVQDGIQKMGLWAYPSEANFLLIHLNQNADVVFEALLRKGIIVRSGVALGFPEAMRVTVGTREQNEAFLRALQEVLEGVKP